MRPLFARKRTTKATGCDSYPIVYAPPKRAMLQTMQERTRPNRFLKKYGEERAAFANFHSLECLLPHDAKWATD